MNKWTQLAKELNSGNPLISGREKIEIESLMQNHDWITINAFNILKGENGDEYSTCTFDEDDKAFFFGGSMLTNTLKEIFSKMGVENFAEASKLLKNGEGIKCRFERSKTREGRPFIKVIFPEE